MLNSLRFRLPALFLAGIALAGLVTSLIALRLFQDYTRNETLKELRQEASGLAAALRRFGGARSRRGQGRPDVRGQEARGRDRRPPLLGRPRAFALPRSGLRPDAPRSADVGVDLSERTGSSRSSSSRPGRTAPSSPPRIPCGSGGERGVTFSYLIVAKPKAELRDDVAHAACRGSRWRSSRACVVVGGLALYLSRRITEPVLALSSAMDEVAEGHYDVEVPQVPGRRRDRPPDRALPGDGGSARRGGAARAQLPDVRLARAAHAADRDPRPRRRAARGRRRPIRSSPTRRSRSSRTRQSGSAGSSATCSTWPS